MWIKGVFPFAAVFLFSLCCQWTCFADDAASAPCWQPGGEFPIGAWGGPKGKFNTAEAWKTVADAGFTYAACGISGEKERLKALDFCQGAGLKLMLLRTEGFNCKKDELKSALAAYNSHPALFGYFIGDEPPYKEFELHRERMSLLRDAAPGKFLYANLLPTDGPFQGSGAINYSDYLQKYIDIAHPMALSYDHYPLGEKGDRLHFFDNFEIARRVALKNDIPYWTYLQLTPHMNPFAPQVGAYRVLSKEEIRWEVYCALAYGFKGILYFTYWTYAGKDYFSPEHPERVSIVDIEGRPTRAYPFIKEINNEVKTLGRTLLKLRSTDVYHTGNDIPIGCARLSGDAILQLPQDVPAILGMFKDPSGVDYAMVVNRDYRNAKSLPIQVAGNVKAVHAISPADGSEMPLPIKKGVFNLALTPGNGCLLKLTTGYDYPPQISPVPVSDGKIGGIWFPGELTTPDFTVCARKTFDLDAAPAKASLFITADNEYCLYVNGKKQGSSDDWEKGAIYDVSKLLAPGRNVIAVKACNTDGAAGIFATLALTAKNGAASSVECDSSWKVSSKEEAKWTEPGFDDSKWTQAAVIGNFPCEPWARSFKGFFPAPVQGK